MDRLRCIRDENDVAREGIQLFEQGRDTDRRARAIRGSSEEQLAFARVASERDQEQVARRRFGDDLREALREGIARGLVAEQAVDFESGEREAIGAEARALLGAIQLAQGVVALGVLVLLDPKLLELVHILHHDPEHHAHFIVDGWPGFYVIYGFATCWVMVMASKLVSRKCRIPSATGVSWRST